MTFHHTVPHKFFGNTSSFLYTQSLSLHQETSRDFSFAVYRQHSISSSLRQPIEKDKVPVQTIYHSYSTADYTAGECHGGLLVKAANSQDGLDVRTQHFQRCEQLLDLLHVDIFMQFAFQSNFFVSSAGNPIPRQRPQMLLHRAEPIPRFCASYLVPHFMRNYNTSCCTPGFPSFPP